jgi:hypothetical protein
MMDSDMARSALLNQADTLHRLARRLDMEGLDRMGRENVRNELEDIMRSLRDMHNRLSDTDGSEPGEKE